MVRGAALTLMLALAWLSSTGASVLVPTYVLPPDSFLREQRSLASPPDTHTAESQRTIKRLIGGHMKIKSDKEYGDSKNSIVYDDKTEKDKSIEVIPPDSSGGNVGWNQGIWDDGMLMSSAGEGKNAAKIKEVDEDKKTLSDQVAEGKYGLIQNEIFSAPPKRPGIVSYELNPDTRSKDNLQTLGGLKKDEIWLAEDHLLVLTGGSYPERTKESENRPWPPIDDYEAPRRQVKLPMKPKVPPPFPVRLSDDGPLVFLTPNGSVPAPPFAFYPPGEGEGAVPPTPFFFEPETSNPQSGDKRNTTTGGASLPDSAFPFLPRNASEEAFPFPPPINGSFPEGFPPGAAYLPPPNNQSDLYDEDDPSIYYPPPYNFSYHTDYNNSVPAGPLVPGIILPPPPDFFAPLEEKTTEAVKTTTRPSTTSYRPKPTAKRPTSSQRNRYKPRPTTTESTKTEPPTTITTPPTVEIVTRPIVRKPQRIVQIPSRIPAVKDSADVITAIPKTEKPAYKTRTKLTSKPLSVSVLYDYPEQIYEAKPPKTSENPYIIYNIQGNEPNRIPNNRVTSTPVPLRAYYTNTQNDVPTTKLQPVYSNIQPNDNAVTSFYFYDEQPKTSPAPTTYYDGRDYYNTVPFNETPVQHHQNLNTQSGFNPSVDVSYGALDQTDALYLWPQKQGPRTLTQEYFSIQKPQTPYYVQQQPKHQPNAFYQQIADIQQTIDLYSTRRPKIQSQRPRVHKGKAINSRPVYQLNYQPKQRPEHNPFRAPKLDPEPFRPMVSYSKPFDVENSLNTVTPSALALPQQYLIETVQVTTEKPTSSRYYPKTKVRDQDYNDTPNKKNVRPTQHLNLIPIQNDKPYSPHNNNIHKAPSTTISPISHGYYTKQDERYFDDITKNSFDIFGKKIEDKKHDVHGLAVTPPLGTVGTPVDNDINLNYEYEIIESQSPNPPSLDKDTLVNHRYPRPPINPDSEPNPHQGYRISEPAQPQRPPNLADDTLVNDRYPRPTIDPDSEFVPISDPSYRPLQDYRVPNQVQRPKFNGEQYDLNAPSLAGDIDVNYKRPLPPINPDAEWIAQPNSAGEGRPGSFVSYRLPGEGAHVYFLTPQAAQAQQRERYRSPGYGR